MPLGYPIGWGFDPERHRPRVSNNEAHSTEINHILSQAESARRAGLHESMALEELYFDILYAVELHVGGAEETEADVATQEDSGDSLYWQSSHGTVGYTSRIDGFGVTVPDTLTVSRMSPRLYRALGHVAHRTAAEIAEVQLAVQIHGLGRGESKPEVTATLTESNEKATGRAGVELSGTYADMLHLLRRFKLLKSVR